MEAFPLQLSGLLQLSEKLLLLPFYKSRNKSRLTADKLISTYQNV